MYQHKIICSWVHYTGLSRVQNKSSPQIRRSFNKSARLPHRLRRRRIDRPALQPHRCRAGAYVYEYNVSLSGTPPLPQGWRCSPPNTTLTGYGENTEPTARAPLDTSIPPLDCTYFLHPLELLTLPLPAENIRIHFR